MLPLLPLLLVILAAAAWSIRRLVRKAPANAENATSGKWRRFRKNPRAMLSIALLGVLYVTSLGSELICNSRPLYLRVNGHAHAPFLRYLSQDDAFGEGGSGEVDYVRLESDPRFATNPANRVIFAPCRFGPQDIVDPGSLKTDRRFQATIRYRVRMGRCDIARDLSCTGRQAGCEPFLDNPPRSPADFYDLPAAFREAVSNRFANLPAPAFTATVQCREDLPAATGGFQPAPRVEISLREYRPRSRPPKKLRLRLTDPETEVRAPVSLVLGTTDEGIRPLRSSRNAWESLDETTRDSLLQAARDSEKATGEIKRKIGDDASLSLSREIIAWPYRPVTGHWLGIDSAGRDVFARILYGTRTAMTFGLLLVIWSMLIGIAAGAIQGFFGGWVDLLGQRFIEIWSSLPFLYVMILVGSVFGRSFGLLLFCYGLFNWIGISYYVRAEFLRLRNRPFVDAARCQGLSAARIMWRHILPNALTPVITLLPFNLVGAIGSISALDFLGFGLPPLTPSWGELLQQAQQYVSAWWLILYPSLILFLVMLLAVFVGEGLRDAFDPKPASRYH